MTNVRFHLTRRAAGDLRAIHRHFLEEWGEETARAYMAKLYAAMVAVAERPETGLLRRHRSAPFRMVPAGRHFVVYDATDIGIIILTVLHQRRDIERIIAGFTPDFLEQVGPQDREIARWLQARTGSPHRHDAARSPSRERIAVRCMSSRVSRSLFTTPSMRSGILG